MNSNHAAPLLFGLVTLLPPTLAAQAPVCSSGASTGVIVGRVFNQATGAMLEAATIRIAGANTTTISTRNGDFILTAPSGSHTLVIDYSGLNTLQLPVTVRPGESTTVEAPMNSDAYKLDVFLVEGIREGEARAIQVQRTAMNQKLVVATDTFGTGEFASPASLLSRLPGFAGHDYMEGTFFLRGLNQNFTVMTVDGNDFLGASKKGGSMQRGVNIVDSLPTDNIASVELGRATTPDMSASAVAGQINLVTKRPFENPGRRITLTVGTAWTNVGTPAPSHLKDKPGLDMLNFNYSNTFSVRGGQNNLGILFNLSRRNLAQQQSLVGGQNVIRVQNAVIEPTPANGLTSPLLRGVGGTLTFNEYFQYGYGLNIDYRTRGGTYVYFRNNYSHNSPGPEPWTQWGASVTTGTNPAQAFAPGSTSELQTALPIAASRSVVTVQSGSTCFATYAGSAGFEHKTADGSSVLSFDLNYTINRHWSSDWGQASFEFGDVGWTLARRGQDPWFPVFTQTSGPSIQYPANYMPGGILRQRQSTPKQRYGVRLDWLKNFETTVPACLKVGGRFDQMDGSQNRAVATYTYTGTRGMEPFLMDSFAVGQGRYGPFPFPVRPGSGGKADITDFEANSTIVTQTAQDAYNSITNDFRQDAEFTERISAVYVMGGLTLKEFKMLGGVRVEDAKNISHAYAAKTSAVAGTTFVASLSRDENMARALKQFADGMIQTKGKYREVFPGIHFVYEPFERLQFRASYNLSVSRGGNPPDGQLDRPPPVAGPGKPRHQRLRRTVVQVRPQNRLSLQ